MNSYEKRTNLAKNLVLYINHYDSVYPESRLIQHIING